MTSAFHFHVAHSYIHCNRKQYQYCYYCTEALKRSGLARHCKDQHEKPARALKEGDIPTHPKYINWREWIRDPARVNPKKVPDICKRRPDLSYTAPLR